MTDRPEHLPTGDAELWLLHNNAVTSTTVETFVAGFSMSLADLNGDGKKDILYDNGSLQYAWYMNGTAPNWSLVVSHSEVTKNVRPNERIDDQA